MRKIKFKTKPRFPTKIKFLGGISKPQIVKFKYNCMKESNQDKEESLIQKELGHLQKEIDELDEVIKVLEDELNPVLHPAAVEPQDKEKPLPLSVKLANEVKISADRIHQKTAEIRDLIERCELWNSMNFNLFKKPNDEL